MSNENNASIETPCRYFDLFSYPLVWQVYGVGLLACHHPLHCTPGNHLQGTQASWEGFLPVYHLQLLRGALHPHHGREQHHAVPSRPHPRPVRWSLPHHLQLPSLLCPNHCHCGQLHQDLLRPLQVRNLLFILILKWTLTSWDWAGAQPGWDSQPGATQLSWILCLLLCSILGWILSCIFGWILGLILVSILGFNIGFDIGVQY